MPNTILPNRLRLQRTDGRQPDQARPVTIALGYSPQAEGSALITTGDTIVLCTATIEQGVPRWLSGSGRGWVTAEYGMLPRSTSTRTEREARRGKQGGRTLEIQRLIGRSLRAVTDMSGFGEKTVIVDCDVLRADGGTRTAAITGAYVALKQAFAVLVNNKEAKSMPLLDAVAAISVGMINNEPVLDLNYIEDSSADTDLNVVMTGTLRYVEVQGTAEGEPFAREQLDGMLRLAGAGITHLLEVQRQAIGSI